MCLKCGGETNERRCAGHASYLFHKWVWPGATVIKRKKEASGLGPAHAFTIFPLMRGGVIPQQGGARRTRPFAVRRGGIPACDEMKFYPRDSADREYVGVFVEMRECFETRRQPSTWWQFICLLRLVLSAVVKIQQLDTCRHRQKRCGPDMS
jgi:hypothetical protein